jgi:hypothetical protein
MESAANPTAAPARILWDTTPVKKSIRAGTDKLADVLKPVAVVGVQAIGESIKLTPHGAALAPAIDVSTKVVAPIVIPASIDALKPASHAATDFSVDSSHQVSVKVVSVFNKTEKHK